MDRFSIQAVVDGLPVPARRFFETIGSTNDYALAWAADGVADSALVVANEQTRGRGRAGRSWLTEPGGSLAFSLVLRPTPAEAAFPGRFSPLGALAVCAALEALGLPCQVKWPNDVLVRRKKLCGILAEAAWSGNHLEVVVLGIGVNVASTSVPPEDGLLFPATSVEDEINRPVDRQALLKEILVKLFSWRVKLTGDAFLEAWQSRLAFQGEAVRVAQPNGEELQGALTGVDAQGSLILTQPDGSERRIEAGDVHLRPVGE